MTLTFHRSALALIVIVLALFIALTSCKKECESGLYDLDGECITECNDGWFLGIDGRCHPIEATG